MRQLLAFIMISTSSALLLQRTIIRSRAIARAQSINHIQRYYGTSILCSRELRRTVTYERIRRHSEMKFTSMSSSNLAEDGEAVHSRKKAKIVPKDESGDEKEEDSSLPEEQTEEDYLNSLPKGLSKGYHIISHATVPSTGFSMEQLRKKLESDEINRLEMTETNVPVPVALMILFPKEFGTLTRSRKECRRKKILVLRGSKDGNVSNGGKIHFDHDRMIIGRVGERVLAGDTIAIQARTANGGYEESRKHHKDPPFHLPVVYQDDHIAVVNKPEGVVVFGPKKGGYGRNTVKATLPYVLDPPKVGTLSVLWNPMPVHRIDKATSGLLLVAKTKPAMVHLSNQFRDRKVKKTYTAIVNGIPPEPKDMSITSAAAKALGVCIENSSCTNNIEPMWQLIDDELEEQSAVTIWRTVSTAPLETAMNSTVSMVELKPKTGRFHQLRRHMAWICKCPIIGDSSYDGAGKAIELRKDGMFLCSNKVTLEHPFYSTIDRTSKFNTNQSLSSSCDRVSLTQDDGTVFVNVEISLPQKFRSMMRFTETKTE